MAIVLAFHIYIVRCSNGPIVFSGEIVQVRSGSCYVEEGVMLQSA